MQSRYVKMLIIVIAAGILVAAVMSLLKNINFFINKQEGTAQILSITDLGAQQPYRVSLKFFNKKTQKEVTSTIRLKKSSGKDLKENSNSVVRIQYAKNFPEQVYLADYQSPRSGVILLDLLLITLMALAIVANKDVFKKKKVE